jgi:hypothetical protein
MFQYTYILYNSMAPQNTQTIEDQATVVVAKCYQWYETVLNVPTVCIVRYYVRLTFLSWVRIETN